MYDQDELVSMLREIASYERGFKQQAFDNAASSISSLSTEDFNSYMTKGKYRSLPGVGKSVETCIQEYVISGNISRLDNLRDSNGIKNPLYDY